MNIKGLFITLLFLKRGTKAKHNLVQSPADINHSCPPGSCWMLCSQSGIAFCRMGGGRALGKTGGNKIRSPVDGNSSQSLAVLPEGKV